MKKPDEHLTTRLDNTRPDENPNTHGEAGAIAVTPVFNINKELWARLEALSAEQEVTLFVTLISAFKVLLFRYSGQDDICVVTSTPFFNNLLAIRSKLNADESFDRLLQTVNKTARQAYSHRKVPFDIVAGASVNKQYAIPHPLYQFMFVLQNYAEETLYQEVFEKNTSKFDLTLSITQTADYLQGLIAYSTGLFHNEFITAMKEHYIELLNSIVQLPGQKISALPILTREEEHQLLTGFNDTRTEYKDKTLIDLFEEEAKKKSGNIALIFGDERLTFGQLNEKANQLAHYLKKKGVKEEVLVPICLERSIDMMVGILGILKAGGAYVPIDPEYPEERINYILKDTRAKLVVSTEVSKARLLSVNNQLEIATTDGDVITGETAKNLMSRVMPGQLAYIIYTSGSTGAPKGVMVEHKSIYNFLLTAKEICINEGGNSSGSFIHFPYTFDASLQSMFTSLVSGKLIVISSKKSPDAFEDNNLYKYAPYDYIQLTPAHLDFFNEKFKDAQGNPLTRKLTIGGEALHLTHFNYLREKGASIEVINEYGPTEAAVACTRYSFNILDDNEKIPQRLPIGKPIKNAQIYILNEYNQLVPPGVAGEICIGGVQVARGYLNQSELTKKKFIANPFDSAAGARIYKTGDMGRWLPDGNIECLGRTDDQVKIRGHRIELGEIESALLQSKMADQAAVLAREDNEGKNQLIAYIVPNGAFNKKAIIAHLQDKLPNYMIPALWMELEHFPLTPNGKIDKKSLPDVDVAEQIKDDFVAPDTEPEKMLAEIWKDVLKLKHLGAEDNFFEIGGHSLLAIQIVTKIEHKIGKKFPISILFEHPTVRLLSNFIQTDNTASNWKCLVPIKPSGNKTPLYIVHGVGLNVLHFSSLASHVDSEQPVFGLQAKGLDGIDAPLDSITDMSKFYLSEILEHNPTGPYAIAGYSSGGFIAVEMVHQLELMGKDVKTLCIFDADADFSKHTWFDKRVKCYLPKFMGGVRPEHKKFAEIYKRRIAALNRKLGLAKKPRPTEFETLLNKIKDKQLYALDNYTILPVNRPIYLFRPRITTHINSDIEYLGWRQYTPKGVKYFEIPGSHNTMLLPPNVIEFAGVLQNTLDNC